VPSIQLFLSLIAFSDTSSNVVHVVGNDPTRLLSATTTLQAAPDPYWSTHAW